MKKQKISAKTVALLAMMIALALVFSYVETLIPINFGIPGVKLGLANLVIVAALYLIGGKEAFLVSVVLILKKTDKLSILAVSVLGGICHNIGQLIVAILVVENLKLIFYVPVLLISGFVTGLLIGIVSRVILPAVRRAYAADSAH